jgi:hypothetical protein
VMFSIATTFICDAVLSWCKPCIENIQME